MKTDRRFSQGFLGGFGLIFLLVVLVGTLWSTAWAFHRIHISQDTFATLLVALVTVAGTLWTLRSTRLKDRELQINAQQAERKEEVYTRFMLNFWKVLQDDKANDKKFMAEMLQDVMVNGSLWMSDKTLKAFVNFRLDAQKDVDAGQIGLDIARFILSMRQDLGHKNKNLSEKDVLDVFINDTDQFIGSKTKRTEK